MKKLITLSVIVLSSLGAFITFTNETTTTSASFKRNGIAGYTGSPGESNCRSCHGSFALNSGGGSVYLKSSDMIGWEYEAGVTYNLTLVVKKTGISLFGFDVEILNSSNANAGSMTATTTTRSSLTSSGGKSNLIHKTGGGASTDSTEISFTWTAPSSDIGNITSYFTGAATNGNNSDNGDYIYSGTQVFTFKAPVNTGIKDHNPTLNMSVFPNPISDKINIDINNQMMNNASIHILDLSGKLVNTLASNVTLAENAKVSYDKPSNLNSGIYFLQISNGTVSKTTRIVVL